MDSRISIFLVFCLVSLAIAQTPGQVRSLAISDIQQWGFSASWQEPLDGNTPVRYDVTIESTNPVREAYEMSFEPASNGVYEVDHLYDSSTYSFSVVAVNSDGQAGEAVVESNIVIPPCRICLDAAGINYFSFIFEPTFSEDRYLVGRSVDATSETEYPPRNLAGGLSSLFYFQPSSPLIPGVLYEFEERRESDDALLAASRYRTTPYPVTNLQVGITGLSVTIEYEQPTEIRENSFGYRISYNDAQGNPLEELVATEDTSVEIIDLEVGVLYSFEVQSYSGEFGDRTYSTIESQEISIVALTLQEQGTTSLTVGWTQTVGNVSRLDVFSIFGGSNSTLTQDLFPDATVATIGSLSPGEVYRVTLFILNANGGEDVVASEVFQTIPLPPNNLEVVEETPLTVTFSWGLEDTQLDNFVIFYMMNGESTNVTVNSGLRSYTLMNLQPDTMYDFSMVTVSGDEESVSVPARGATVALPPNTILSAETTATTINLWFSPIVGPTGAYDVAVEGMEGLNTIIQPDELLNIQLTGLSPSTVYEIQVNRMTQNYRQSVRTNPPNPGNVTDVEPGRFVVEFSFSPGQPTDAVNFYEIYGEDDGTSRILGNPSCCNQVLLASIPAAAPLTFEATGLNPNTPYVYEIRSLLDSAGDFPMQRSNQVQLVEFTTGSLPLGDLDVREITTTTIDLIWLTTGLESLAFFIIYKQADESTFDTSFTRTEPGTQYAEYTLESLLPGELYTVRLQNEENDLNDEITQRTRPNSITRLTTTARTSTSLSLEWGAADGVLSYYEVVYDPPTIYFPRRTEVQADEPLSLTLSGLFPNTTYTVTVVTWSGTGADETSSAPFTGSFQTVQEQPLTLVLLFVNKTQAHFTLGVAAKVNTYSVEVTPRESLQSY